MLQYNTMRFGTDEFKPFIKQALLVSNAPLNLTAYNRLDSILALGDEPEGSKRRFMFKMDNKVYKFSGQNLVEYTGSVTLDNVLSNGNSAAQIANVSNNAQLVGKNIYPIIALYTETELLPTAKIVANASFVQEVLDDVVEHLPMYFHDEIVDPEGRRVEGKILGFSWDIDINGDAEAGFKVKLLQNGEWTDYMTLTEAKGQNAKGIRPKYYYHVDAFNGTNSVKIRKFAAHWSPELNFKVYGDTAYLTSVGKNFNLDLKSCVLVVRHEPLDGGSLAADVSFQKKRKTVTGKVLDGNLSAAKKTFTLEDKFLPHTLKLYINGTRTTDFTFDTATNSVTIPFDSSRHGIDNTVTADYTYDADEETWLPMTADAAEPADNGLYTTRFFLENTADNKKLGAIRLAVTRGRDVKSKSYTATGEEQSVTFSREPDDIECDADSWVFDDDTNTLTFTSTKDSTVNVSYSWHGQTPVIRGWQAAFTC